VAWELKINQRCYIRIFLQLAGIDHWLRRLISYNQYRSVKGKAIPVTGHESP
jgi:hypothetical protein